MALQYFNTRKESIKELEMINDADVQNIVNDIQNKGFIIGSLSGNTGFSFSTKPAVHSTAQAARTEAKRLSLAHPGKLFVIVQLYGAELVPLHQSFSI